MKKKNKKKDTQLVELAGRNRLASELQLAEIEVARPERDHGIDLVAFWDKGPFHACPIQMKASSRENFDIHRRYAEFQGIFLVYVWNLDDSVSRFFALSYSEAETVAKKMGWTKTASWRGEISSGRAGYGTRSPSPKLRRLLDKYEIKEPQQWVARMFPGVTKRSKRK